MDNSKIDMKMTMNDTCNKCETNEKGNNLNFKLIKKQRM